METYFAVHTYEKRNAVVGKFPTILRLQLWPSEGRDSIFKDYKVKNHINLV